MDNTSQNLTDQCGTYNYPISCPVQRPVNGHGGSCDHVPFYISVCNIDFLASDSDPSNPNATYGHFDQQIPGVLYSTYTLQENLSWHQIDRFYRQNSTIAVIHSICLTLGILTLLNILSLTPASKRLKASFWILLSGAICVIVSSACALQLNTSDTSAYLQLTNDWVSTTWSVGYKARTIACQSGEIIGLIFLQVALYIQAKAILTWVKLRNEKVYYSVLLFLGLMGIAAWCWRAIWGMYQIRFLAFVPEGGYRPSYFELWPGTYYVKFSNGFVGASLGLWCLVILVSSVQTILARNEALFRSDIHGGARKWRESTVRTTYESAVRCIGFVSVQSFAVPILLIIISYLPVTIVPLEPLIQPVLFTLLPYSSLFGQAASESNSSSSKQQSKIADVSGTTAHSSYQPYRHIPEAANSVSVPRVGTVELADMSLKSLVADSKKRSAGRNIDSELAEIDRMG